MNKNFSRVSIILLNKNQKILKAPLTLVCSQDDKAQNCYKMLKLATKTVNTDIFNEVWQTISFLLLCLYFSKKEDNDKSKYCLLSFIILQNCTAATYFKYFAFEEMTT